MRSKQKCDSISALGNWSQTASRIPHQTGSLVAVKGSKIKEGLSPDMKHMVELFSDVLLGLGRATRELKVNDFQRQALELAKPILGFDSALWGSGSIRMGEPVTHAMYLYNQPEEMWLTWAKYAHQDRLIGMMLTSPGITVNANEHKLMRGLEIYDELCVPFGIEHVLCTCIIDPITSLYNVISLYRADRNNPYSEEERQFKQNLMPHWIEHHRTNRMLHLLNQRLPMESRVQCAAAADREGVLHLIEPQFTDLLRGEWPTWRGPVLPEEFSVLLQGKVTRYTGTTLVASVRPMENLFMLRARRKNQTDSLSEREREVAEQFAYGLTYKEIAKYLKIAPATVRNHLNAIYVKLGVRNKAEMMTKLKNLE